MKNNGSMPAMPCEVVEVYHVDVSQVPAGLSPADDFTSRERKVMSGGMTKREMMAMHIISGLASHQDMMQANADGAHDSVGQAVAAQSVLLADYLLAELERTK